MIVRVMRCGDECRGVFAGDVGKRLISKLARVGFYVARPIARTDIATSKWQAHFIRKLCDKRRITLRLITEMMLNVSNDQTQLPLTPPSQER